MEKGADALDKLEVKVQRSVGNEKKVRERRKGWEEVNDGKKKKGGFEVLGDGEEDGGKEREWVSDEEMDGAADVVVPEVSGEVKEVVVLPASVPLPPPVDGEEML